MVISNRSKDTNLNIRQESTYQQLVAKFKKTVFTLTNAHLVQNQNSSPFMYYLFLFLEHLALLWFILHPGLGIFGSVYLLQEFRVAMQVLNFQQFLKDNHEIYQTIIIIILMYLLVQIGLIVLSCYHILNNSNGEFSKYLKKIVNLQLIFNVRVLSGPILGVMVNIFYCQQNSPFRAGSVCYNPVHIVFCILSAIIALIILVQVLFFSLLYFIKNPLTTSYMGEYDRYYILSKTLIKILIPVYFAVDYRQSLAVVYISLVAALWGFYIFWHRLFSTHSYEQKHFYVEYFMESTVAWMAVNNVLSYYIEGKETEQKMNLMYSLFTSILVAILLLNIEKSSQQKFVEECLQKKIKKQSMQRFVFILINKFLHKNSKQSKLIFQVYSKLISKNIQKFKQIDEKLQRSNYKTQKQEVYRFLYVLVESFLQENNSVILKALKCYFLNYLGQKTYGLHQSIELQEQRLGLVDEFMLFQFNINQNVFDSERLDKVGIEFVKYYRFHEQLEKLETVIEICASNNMEYWDQLCESDPSISKLRNLATVYVKYYNKITKQYEKVVQQFPQNYYSTNFYLNFLMNVAVDTKQTIKIKQKLANILENRSKISKKVQMKFSEDEEVSIMTLNSIGNSLGIIINCNKMVEQTLGFQKNVIIGKNVTKIMPKIYSELHNSFMTNFIRNQTSHLKPSQKLVTALNKNSLLIEINLTVRMMTTAQNALAIVGFMKKVQKSGEDKEKGLLMFSLNTSQILGIDSQFQRIMNNKLTGKQIAQDQIRLNSIMPQLNLQIFQKQKTAHTVIEVGNVADLDEMETQLTKHVKLQLRSTKYYEGINIAFMTVSQSKNNKINNSSSLNLDDKLVSLTQIATPNLLIMGQNKSIFQNEVSIHVERNDDGLIQQLPLAKKIEQYIVNNQKNSIKLFVKFIIIAAVLGCTALATTVYLTHASKLQKMNEMYNELNQTTYLSYYLGRINLLNSLVWSVENIGTQPNYTQWLPQYRNDYVQFRNTFKSLVSVTNKYEDNLEYNKISYYKFKYYTYANSTYNQYSIYTTNMNLYNTYLKSSGEFLYANFTSNLEAISLQLQALFVRANGDQSLPIILERATALYQQFFKNYIRDQFQKMAFIKTGFLLLSIGAILIISYIGIYISRINGQVVNIYKNIRLWDISQLSSKCKVFLGSMGVKINKKRTSSLLRIFPRKTFLQLISHFKEKETQIAIPNSTTSKNGLSQQLSLRQVMSPNQLLTPSILNETNQLIDNQQSFLRGNEVEPTVQLFWQQKNKKIVFATLGLVLIIILAMVGSMYYQDSYTKQLYDKIQMLQRIGTTRATINYISYFSFRIIQNPNDERVRNLLNQNIYKFYQYSRLTSNYLGDPQPALKGIYTYIQTIQQWLSQPNISSQNVLLANYTTIYDGLKKGCQLIQQLSLTLFLEDYRSVLFGKQTTQLVSTIFLILIVCLLLLIIYWFYLSPIYKQSKHSLNMINILPAWIFQRNSQALDFLVQ